jgi:drug/metabolite transporter (DMT)-like permease
VSAAGAVSVRPLTPGAFATLLLLACLFGANHVAARIALDHGVDVATAVAARSGATAVVVGLIVWRAGLAVRLNRRQTRVMLGIGVLVAVQSALLYSAVARIPVGLALLAFNTYPLCAAAAVGLLYGHRPERAVLIAMPVILGGLALALDIAGQASGLGTATQWDRLGTGVLLAVGAAVVFGVVLALTQHEVAMLDGRLRSALTMAIVGVLAALAVAVQGGPHWPRDATGWWALAALSLLYGTAFTVMFTLLPKLGVVGNSPILNVEPVAALLMAWALLGQAISASQWLGALVVVGTVMALGLRRR